MAFKSIICGIVLILSCLICFRSGDQLHFPDEVEYHHLAQSLASGNGFSLENGSPTTYRPPGYPFFLSLLYRIHPNPFTAKLANAFLLAASVWLMCHMSGNALPGIFLLAYPVLLYSASTLYPQTLSGFLLLIITIGLCQREIPEREISRRILLCIGFLLGGLILSVPSFLLTAPVLAWILFRNSKSPLIPRLIQVSIFTFSTLAIVAPWTYRNYKAFDAFIPVSANSGLNLYLGNSPNAGPNTGVNVERSEILETVQDFNEIETDRYYRHQALDWIKSNPLAALKLYTAKSLNYFNFRNELKTASQSSALKDLMMFVTWYPLLGLFVARLFFIHKFPLSPLEKAIYLLVISNVFLSAIFFTRIRFRLPFDQLMILANAIFVGRLLPNCGFFPFKPLTKPEIAL